MDSKISITKTPFKLTDETIDPSDINYDIYGLQKRRVITSGELRQIDYFRSYDFDTDTYSDLVLTEYRTYIRNSIGIVQYRNLSIDWYCTDDSIGKTKETRKYYTVEEAIQEGIDRRSNMIAFAKTTLLDELEAVVGAPTNQSYAFDLLLSVKTEMDYFVQGYTQPLRDAVNNSAKPYLTSDIKVAVVAQLTF